MNKPSHAKVAARPPGSRAPAVSSRSHLLHRSSATSLSRRPIRPPLLFFVLFCCFFTPLRGCSAPCDGFLLRSPPLPPPPPSKSTFFSARAPRRTIERLDSIVAPLHPTAAPANSRFCLQVEPRAVRIACPPVSQRQRDPPVPSLATLPPSRVRPPARGRALIRTPWRDCQSPSFISFVRRARLRHFFSFVPREKRRALTLAHIHALDSFSAGVTFVPIARSDNALLAKRSDNAVLARCPAHSPFSCILPSLFRPSSPPPPLCLQRFLSLPTARSHARQTFEWLRASLSIQAPTAFLQCSLSLPAAVTSNSYPRPLGSEHLPSAPPSASVFLRNPALPDEWLFRLCPHTSIRSMHPGSDIRCIPSLFFRFVARVSAAASYAALAQPASLSCVLWICRSLICSRTLSLRFHVHAASIFACKSKGTTRCHQTPDASLPFKARPIGSAVSEPASTGRHGFLCPLSIFLLFVYPLVLRLFEPPTFSRFPAVCLALRQLASTCRTALAPSLSLPPQAASTRRTVRLADRISFPRVAFVQPPAVLCYPASCSRDDPLSFPSLGRLRCASSFLLFSLFSPPLSFFFLSSLLSFPLFLPFELFSPCLHLFPFFLFFLSFPRSFHLRVFTFPPCAFSFRTEHTRGNGGAFESDEAGRQGGGSGSRGGVCEAGFVPNDLCRTICARESKVDGRLGERW